MDALNPAKRRAAQRPTPQRVYVKVTSEFDATGYMQPRAITWADGRTFAIDAVRDFRPEIRQRAARAAVADAGQRRRRRFLHGGTGIVQQQIFQRRHVRGHLDHRR